MKQLFRNNRGEIYLKEIEPPTLRGTGAIVRTVCSFIGSGTETQRIPDLRKNPGDGREESALSYQSCGRIVECSPDLTGYEEGMLVACNGMNYGMHGEMAYVPKHMLAPVPANVKPEEAAACNLGLTGIQAIRKAQIQLGDHVVVVGLGIVGLLTAQLARLCGARVIATDLHDARLERARALGVELALNPQKVDVSAAVLERTGGVGADCALICAGGPHSSAPVAQGVELLRRRGALVIVGIVKVELDAAAMNIKDPVVAFCGGRGPGYRDPSYEVEGIDYPFHFVRWTQQRNMFEYLRLVGAGQLEVASLITHRFSIDDAPQAYETILCHPQDTLGVVIEYDAT